METQSTNPAPKTNSIIGQIVRFAVVGGINTAVDWVILFGLTRATGIYEGNGLIPLNTISFTAAVINSYLLNKKWTFKDVDTANSGKKFSSFLLVSIVGALINTAVLRLVSTNIDPMFGLSQQVWLFVAKAAATGIGLAWNFIGYKLFVFKNK
jgi:putative flippase GtrA